MIEYKKYNNEFLQFEIGEWEMKNQESAQVTPYTVRMTWESLNEIADSLGEGDWEYYGQEIVIKKVEELISEKIPFFRDSLFVNVVVDDLAETWVMAVRNDFLES